MDSSTGRKSRPEIVSPAGNPEKLKFAVRYGADAVYFGGDFHNLRVRADNFSIQEIRDAVKFCLESGVRTVFLLNSFLHENDISAAREYISLLDGIGFDALMVSDPGMMMLIRETGTSADLHLSTQMSTLNHLSIKFWNSIGFKRIVLARETTLDEIKMIRGETDAEIEVFVHGALCISYSGRCLMSRYLSGRDANMGDCSHPCRWKYSLVEKKRPGSYLDLIEHEDGTEIISSKDLCLIEKIRQYSKAGVDAFKIEGRMKSLYYTANVTRIYRHASMAATDGEFMDNLPFWKEELDLVSHRPYTDDLFNEFGEMGFTGTPYIKRSQFMGYKSSMGAGSSIEIMAANPIRIGDELDAIYPIKNKIIDGRCRVMEIIDRDGGSVNMARPAENYTVVFDEPVADDAIFRKRLS
ncbi:MAG: U32 family peptidase [Spirochaetes bacterium]|jgi:putative protease|nr:U32 family peptidase [Spirochaetota bacterium]